MVFFFRLNGFMDNFIKEIDEWKFIYDHSHPQTLVFPSPYQKAEGLTRLILLRLKIKYFRSGKLISSI